MARIGCNASADATLPNFTAFGNLLTTIGKPKQNYARLFAATESPGHSKFNLVETQINAGYNVCFSWKPGPGLTWSDVVGGQDDARIDNIAEFCAELVPTEIGNYAAMSHEPEGDSNDGAAAWRSMQQRAYTRFKAIAPNWAFGPIIMGSSMQSDPNNSGGRTPDPWFVPGFQDFHGVDWYNYRGPAQGNSSGWGTNAYRNVEGFQEWIDLIVSKGISRIIIPETTSYPSSASAPNLATNTAWIQSFADRYRDETKLEAIMWYEKDRNDSSFGNGRLSGGVTGSQPLAMAAFEDIRTPGEVDPPDPDPEPDPDFMQGQFGVAQRLRMS